MIYTELTKKAMIIAYQAHHGQFDKGGMPYVFHPLHLAEQMNDENTTVVALLHDVIEDTRHSFKKLKTEGFSDEIVEALLLLTHKKDRPYLDYVKRIRGNRIASVVKIADLMHNCDISRLDSIDKETLSRIEKYRQAIALLTESEFTEVVAALIWDNDKFLICQRPANKARGLLWEFVGGKVEPGETKKDALIRECREEIGVSVSIGEEFMRAVHKYPDLTVYLTIFNATIVTGEVQKMEHNDICWITPDEIPNYEFCPADEEILKKIMEKYKK